jgi:hypothetical protein
MAVTFFTGPPVTVYTRGNPVQYNVRTDVGSGTLNLRIVFRVVITDLSGGNSKEYIQSAEPVFAFGPGYAIFDIWKILHDYFKEFDFPGGLTNITKATKGLCKFYVEAWDISGDPTETSDAVPWNDDGGTAVWGGIAWEWDKGNTFLTTRMNDLFPSVPFLTWHPQSMYVTPDQDEYLYYFVSDDEITELKLKAKCYRNNNTTQTVVPRTKTGIGPAEIYIIPVGFNAIVGPEMGYPELCWKYDVWLENQDGEKVSQVRTYFLDRKYYNNHRYFIFQTSLYGGDTLHTTGEGEEKNDLKSREVSIINNAIAYNVALGQNKNVDFLNQKGMKVTTGELTKAEVNWLDDMFCSPNVYEKLQGRYVPIRITSKSIAKGKDNDQRRTITFEYEYRFKNMVHTPYSIDVADAPIDIEISPD